MYKIHVRAVMRTKAGGKYENGGVRYMYTCVIEYFDLVQFLAKHPTSLCVCVCVCVCPYVLVLVVDDVVVFYLLS